MRLHFIGDQEVLRSGFGCRDMNGGMGSTRDADRRDRDRDRARDRDRERDRDRKRHEREPGERDYREDPHRYDTLKSCEEVSESYYLKVSESKQ